MAMVTFYQVYKNDIHPELGLPILNRQSCFYTKLLANSDRRTEAPFKDIFDILAMSVHWGGIPEEAIILAKKHYGQCVMRDLKSALEDVTAYPEKYVQAANAVNMTVQWQDKLINFEAPRLLSELETK